MIGRRLVALEVLREEVVVEFDHVVDEVLVFDAFGLGEIGGNVGGFGMTGVVDERMMGEQIGHAVEARLGADRQLGRVGV